MKIKKQKSFTLLAIFGALTVLTMSLKQPIATHAHEHAANEEAVHEHNTRKLSKNNTIENENVNAADFVSEIEEELHENGSSVVAELSKKYNYYHEELRNTSNDEKEEILSKLTKLEEMINEYDNNISLFPADSKLGNENQTATFSVAIFGISPNCTCNFWNYFFDNPCPNCHIYSAVLSAVSTIAAGFSLRGWDLAFDLLMHGRSNTILDSSYTPSANLVNRAANSPQVMNDVMSQVKLAGSCDQDSPGRLNGLFADTNEGDVFNALGSFYYSKSYAGKNAQGKDMVDISIMDRYDYERESGSPGGVIIDYMVDAQELGILVPFYTRMDMRVLGTAPISWEYTSTGFSITGAANSSITQIDIPNSLLNLTVNQMNLPNSFVTAIGDNAFSGYTQLSQITIPASITTIGQNAFKGCTNLSVISIPQSVITIGANAFQYCSNLTIYTERVLRPKGWSSSWNSSGRPVIWGGPDREIFTDSFNLSSYNFPSQYNNFTPIDEDITSQSGQSITTTRLRCGVIEYGGKSYLTLSAKNKYATEAYLEYYFSDSLLEIDYQLALWSSSESLILNSSIRLEALYDFQWAPVRTFGASSMSQDKDLLINYSTVLDEPTRAIRFIVETNQVNNDNNKGRVVIGDINVVFLEYNHEHSLVYKYISPNLHSIMCQECDYFRTGTHAFYQNKCLGCDYIKNPIIVLDHKHDEEDLNTL